MTLTAEQITLQNHIKATENCDVEDDLIVYYFNMGMTTPYEYDRDGLANEAYELYYELMGVKPKWMGYWGWPIEALEEEIKSLQESLRKREEDIQEEKLSVKKAHQERIAANSYKPNLAFAGLKDLLATS